MEHPLDDMPDNAKRLLNNLIELRKRITDAFPEGMVRGIGGGSGGDNPGQLRVFFNEEYDTLENRATVDAIAESHGIKIIW